MTDKRIALVTGGNRGIGLELCTQLAKMNYKVILSSRTPPKGIKKAALLDEEGLDVVHCQLDVSNPDSIAKAYEQVVKQWGRLDVLINNAAILIDGMEHSTHPSGLFKTSMEVLIKTFETNTAGAFLLCEAFLPLMISNNYGRIVNVSSGAGRLTDMTDGYPAYRLSKTALNAVTRIFASRGEKHNVLVNSVDPGWVRTDMGGQNAPRSLEEGVDTILWAASLPDDGPSGGFFLDRKPVAW